MQKLLLHAQSRKTDKSIFYLTLTLLVLGLIAVADASSPQALKVFNDRYYFFKQQFMWAAVGLAGMIISSLINYNVYKKLALLIFGFSIILLIAVLIPGLGSKFLGARRWLFLGPISIQPSEIVKLALAIYLAKLSDSKKGIVSYIIPLVVVLVLVMGQPDLGTSLVIVTIGFSQMFVSGLSLKQYFLTIIGGILAGIPVIMLSDYRRSRLMTFLNQSIDPLGRDYHVRQILLALGSGGLLGVGLGQSKQKFLFLPEAATDSIFSIIAEEIGFVGSVLLIGLFVFYIFKLFKIVRTAPDTFSGSLALGITVWISVQMILNIGSNVALVPLTGITLPFFSYGGSSLVVLLYSVGVLLNISKYAKK